MGGTRELKISSAQDLSKTKQTKTALLSEDWLTHHTPGIFRKMKQLAKGLSKEPHLGDQSIGTSGPGTLHGISKRCSGSWPGMSLGSNIHQHRKPLFTPRKEGMWSKSLRRVLGRYCNLKRWSPPPIAQWSGWDWSTGEEVIWPCSKNTVLWQHKMTEILKGLETRC